MDADGLKERFEPFGAVTVKRMYGGHRVYAEDLCFAVESGGEVFLKVDARSQPDIFRRRLAVHLRGQGQADDDVLLAPSGKSARRGRRTHPLGRAGARGGAVRG